MYNFDKVIDRSGSDDLKHGALLPRWGRDDLPQGFPAVYAGC